MGTLEMNGKVTTGESVRDARMETVFYLTLFVTAAEAGLILWDLVTMLPGVGALFGLAGGNTVVARAGLSTLYLALLTIYAGVKEFDRWTSRTRGTDEVPEEKVRQFRRGESIVAFWVLLATVSYVLESMELVGRMPHELERVTLQALGVMFGTMISKGAFTRRARTLAKNPAKPKAQAASETVPPSAAEPQAAELTEEQCRAKVLGAVRAAGDITTGRCAALLGFDDNRAWRLLEKMERDGVLKNVGVGRGSRYVLADSSKAKDNPAA